MLLLGATRLGNVDVDDASSPPPSMKTTTTRAPTVEKEGEEGEGSAAANLNCRCGSELSGSSGGVAGLVTVAATKHVVLLDPECAVVT